MISVQSCKHPFSFDPEKTALLVIDMQNDFCDPGGFLAGELGLDLKHIRPIIPKIQNLSEWSRKVGIKVQCFTRESHRPDLSDLTESKKVRYANSGSPIGQTGKMGRFLVQGEKCCEIIKELQPSIKDSDWQLDKPAHSCFVHTKLDDMLQGAGITHLLLSGVTTQCCVLATYRHASDLGYYCLLVQDCCAAFDEKDHESTVHVLQSEDGVLGWVLPSSDDLITAEIK